MHPNDLDPAALPWSPEAESSVLGGLLLDNGTFDHVGDLLVADQFFDTRHARIWTAVASMITACKPADVLTVLDLLQTTGRAAGIDLAYMHSLAQYVPSASSIRRYAEIVAEKALMRALLVAADDVRTIATTPGLPVPERLDRAHARLQEVQGQRVRLAPVQAEELIVSLLDRVQDLADGRVEPGIPTGIATLSRMLGGGFRGGRQIILAARPSVGKSSFAEQLLINVAQGGHAAAMFSMEMGHDELIDRAAANIGRIALDRLVTGKLTDDEWTRLTEAVEAIRGLPLFFDDQPALTLTDIAAKARVLKRQHNLKVLAIDYLQLCGSGKTDESRHHQIEELSRGLKTLARQLDITILSLSQLNRQVEQRASGRPILSDLKESGSIEEDADTVLFLSRHHDLPDGTRVIACDSPKNRQGRTGEFALAFNGVYQRWEESDESIAPKAAASRSYTREI